MRKKRRFAPIAACLMAALLLAGCAEEPAASTEEPRTAEQTVNTAAGEETPAEETVQAKRLCLPYDKSAAMNPYFCDSACNRTVNCLIYECLFTINPDYEAERELCEDCVSDDGLVWDITLKSGICFSDGKALTARDAVCSLSAAMQSGSVYDSRLENVSTVLELDELRLRIELKEPNQNLPGLLDIPIVADGQADASCPTGTGPYVFREGKTPSLEPNSHWWKGARQDSVTLVLTDSDEQQLFDFQTGTTNLLVYDRTATGAAGYRDNCESYAVGTSVMQYLGFNTDGFFTGEADTRAALSLAAERETLVRQIYGGSASAAYYPAYPDSPMYTRPESREYGAEAVRQALLDSGFVPTADETGLQKYRTKLVLDFIVNRENSYKVQAAQMIAENLRLAGAEVNLRVLEWDYFCQELQNRNFDIYYGEIRLQNDFDISELTRSYGRLNYGNYASGEFDSLLNAYMSGEADREALDAALLKLCPISTLLFKNEMLLTTRGLLRNATPAPGDPFYGFENWDVSA